MKLLVLGGTGFVGRALISQLASDPGGAGLQVTVPSRHPARHKSLGMVPNVSLVKADVHDDVTLDRLLRTGCEAVVNLVAVLHGDPARFQRVHVELPRRLAVACRAAGVRRLVHVSALGVPEPSVGNGNRNGIDEAPSRYLASKSAGETVLRSAVNDGVLDLSVLRPSVIFGAEDRFINLFARLQRLAPFVPLACAQAQFQPVWVADVACAILRCLGDRATIGMTYECAGPEMYCLADLVRLAGRWSGHPRPVIALPAWAGQLQAALLAWLPGEPLMSRDNLASMRVPNVASGQWPGLAQLDIRPASLASVMQAVVSTAPDSLDRLRTSAGR